MLIELRRSISGDGGHCSKALGSVKTDRSEVGNASAEIKVSLTVMNSRLNDT